jgi:site-specific DNA recombinase
MTDARSPQRPRAAIYARISRDSEALKEGVGRQIKDCEALAKRLGYEIVEAFVDNDISASSSSRRVRPNYNEMLARARAGQVDAILAYSNSRLTRRVREYLDLIDLVNHHGIVIKTVVSGDHDLSTADGRGAALTVAVWDQAEAERVAERTRRAKKDMREKGEYRGGRRPFGYRKGGLKIKESEAEVVRQATSAVLAGRTLAGITRELNAQGSRTSTGREWTAVQLRDVLTRPRNAGLLSRGQVGRRGFEIVGRAVWPAIVDEDTWRAMFDVLTDSSRRTSPGSDTKWLGSFIYRCGIRLRDAEGNLILDEAGEPKRCGAPLRTTATGQTAARPNHARKVHYRCNARAHLMITQAPTDDFVRAEVVKFLSDPRLVATLSPASPNLAVDRERRTALEARLASFERDYALGQITGAQLQKATASVTAEIEEVDERLAKAIRSSVVSPVLRAGNPGAKFLASPIDVQRAVLAEALRVQVLGADELGLRPGQAWTSDRIRFAPVN